MQALDRIRLYRLQVPLKVPYRLVFAPVEHFDTITAEVIDRDGKAGFGEATILTGYTDETIEDSWQTAKAFAGNLAAAGDRAGRLMTWDTYALLATNNTRWGLKDIIPVAAIGTVRAFEAGVTDIPWSPNRHCKSPVVPARDVDGYLRILDPGLMLFPTEITAVHEEGLRKHAEREKVAFGPDLAVQSVYEIPEPLEKLLPASSR
jgi:hypothetical protein